MFSLQVLGGLSLESDEGEIRAQATQQRRLGLLALLAVAGPRCISRVKLQTWLWPEGSPGRPRHALDQLLYATRRALAVDPFVSSGRELSLDPTVVCSDVARFEAAIRAKAWTDAVSLYRGPLLDGVHLSNEGELELWIEKERTRLSLEHQRALETLAQNAADAGDPIEALGWWRKLAAADPFSSRIALATIKALDEAGDRPAAIQYAQSFQRLVRSALGIEPGAAIEKLLTQLAPGTVGVATPLAAKVARKKSRASTELAPPKTFALPRQFKWRWATPMIALLVTALVVASSSGNKSSAVARAASGHRSRTVDPRAKLAYLRGVNAWSDRSKEGLDTAVIYFRSASEIDPGYAEAYAGLADAYVLLGYSGFRPAEAMFPKAKAAAMRSMELDSTLAAPHAALAHELMWERDFRRSEAEFRKAISLDPSYATAHQWYSMLLMMSGRTQEAVVESGRAAQLDPLSLQIQNTYATFLSASGQREAALRQYEKVVGEEPDSAWVRRNPWLLTNMASVYASNGLYGKAIRAAERAMKAAHNHPRAATTLASIYIKMGQPEMARKAFARADTTNEQYIAHRGLMYARLGETDSAFLWLGRVHDWPIPVMIGLRADGQLDAFRRDPRYDALLRQLGLSD